MGTIPVMINGVIFDKAWKSSRPVVLMGEMNYTDLEVGGGPIYPAQPPGIWGGGNEPFPTPPIQLPPWAGGWQPGIWGPTDPRPTQPIYWPGFPHWPPQPMPPDPPDPGTPKPPPPDGGWGWHPEYGWGYFPMKGGKPQPPGASAPGAAQRK
jgi:hypothetical protein